MSKKIISILLSSIFLMFVALPTIITLIDNSIDISVFYSLADEEEKDSEKNSENEKIVELPFCKNLYFAELSSNNNLAYYFKKYSKPHLNLIFPPPEFQL